ncbi:hypothetical protein H257_02028 [Aphanomyces astaci]|uniref:Uncharacterized protein n=1 Tax=Aphanomyces astaci TaxID=112090 RepID=W4H532_APHAT|nr:hypothetical protein H257_02028 [Aphanomyces astaci]ETV87017.1 hypothetical protein H257_02028 [Aphanomyces astaci]|eukprot:XP_009823816.1 hypothetical protein H257_02028 [Aphanomyces astaci]
MWVQEMMIGNHDAFVDSFRMSRETFLMLDDELVDKAGLQATRRISSVEQLAMFMYFAGHQATSANLQQRFQLSGETITRHLWRVLYAVKQLTPTYMALPLANSPTPAFMENNLKFTPYFSKYRMVIDACNFDLHFTYVLAGWEGSAGDGEVYADALEKGLTMDDDKYDIADAGFGLTLRCLTPYRCIRYHLKEYSLGRLKPQRKDKIFNLRHAQVRNCIERIFGIVKMRFPVMSHGVRYDYGFQVDLVIALCTLNNYIRISGVDCGVFEAQAAALIRQQRDMPLNQNERPQFANEPASEEAKRATFAAVSFGVPRWKRFDVLFLRQLGLTALRQLVLEGAQSTQSRIGPLPLSP